MNGAETNSYKTARRGGAAGGRRGGGGRQKTKYFRGDDRGPVAPVPVVVVLSSLPLSPEKRDGGRETGRTESRVRDNICDSADPRRRRPPRLG